MNTYYDNNANNIEYFPLHGKGRKPRSFEVSRASNLEILEKIDESNIFRDGLIELYNSTKSEDAYKKLSKVSAFIAVLRAEVRKRSIRTIESLESEINELKSQIPQSNPIDSKEFRKIQLANDSLKGEVRAYKEKLATLEAKLKSNTAIANNDSELKKYKKLYEDQLKSNVAIKEVERTKRCELNVMRELNIHREFKLLIKEHIGDDAYLRLIKTASDLVDE